MPRGIFHTEKLQFARHGLKVAVATQGFHGSPISNAVQYYPNQSETSKDNKPVAVLFGWLLAKSKHLEKYGEIYQNHGADIMTVHLEVAEVLRPKKSEETAIQILEQLTSSGVNNKPIIVHGFSVGGFLYSQLVNQVINTSKFKSVKERILGQVFDSPVDFHGIPYGISNAATKNPILRSVMKNGIQSYLTLTSKYTTDIYLERSELFYNMPIQCPSMFLFSKSDIVSDAARIEEVSNHWKSNLKIDVTKKCWDNSPHVSHFYTHPEEYKDLVNTFVKQVVS